MTFDAPPSGPTFAAGGTQLWLTRSFRAAARNVYRHDRALGATRDGAAGRAVSEVLENHWRWVPTS